MRWERSAQRARRVRICAVLVMHVPNCGIHTLCRFPCAPIHPCSLFTGEVGEKPTTHSSRTRTTREDKEAALCTLQINSKVPARRGIVLECMLQQHTR